MKTCFLILALVIHSSFAFSAGEVSFKKEKDRIEVYVNGKLFTAWQHKAWEGSYLYPVIGPDGTNITRHYPMKKGVPSESKDHPHHRSIRFSHRDVNGYSYWAPDRQQGDRTASVDLQEVTKMEGGSSGELVLLNHWMADGKVLIVEVLTLRFQPLENGEMLMDYDVELEAAGQDVEFRDQKDGGMMVRVAGTMKAYDRDAKKKGKGAITNSRGDENENAWGKRATWCDYSGPSVSGNIIGVAIFDHPSNMRHPTHWHARTYGLLTANRFGKGHFEAKAGAKKGDGNYTLKSGEKLTLRHRFYFHHGDAKSVGLDQRFQDYAKDAN